MSSNSVNRLSVGALVYFSNLNIATTYSVNDRAIKVNLIDHHTPIDLAAV